MKVCTSVLLFGLTVSALPAAGLADTKPADANPADSPPAISHTLAGPKFKYNAAKLKVLEARLAKTPKDEKLKAETAEANYEVGYQIEYSNPPSKERYAGSLVKYNRALELNPQHDQAAKEKRGIEGFYKSTGLPIPK